MQYYLNLVVISLGSVLPQSLVSCTRFRFSPAPIVTVQKAKQSVAYSDRVTKVTSHPLSPGILGFGFGIKTSFGFGFGPLGFGVGLGFGPLGFGVDFGMLGFGFDDFQNHCLKIYI